jgi:hypothetical protein
VPIPAAPSTFPHTPEIDSHSIQWSLTPVESPMNQGNVRRRARPGDRTASITQVVEMSWAEAQAFKTFWLDTLVLGTSRFTWTVWDGTAYQSGREVQFVGEPPRIPPRSHNRVRVPMTLRVYDLA